MRILSQDGMNFNDIPYDKFCFGILKNERTDKFSIVVSDGVIERSAFSHHDILAEYSTEAKAKRAMEMLHNEYHGYKVEEVYHEGTEYYHPIFQFPADEELEIVTVGKK